MHMNISSFHTHTRLCKHATGEPVDYVRQAAAEGCSALGISDHCPYPDPTWAGSRMTVADVPEYLQLVARARETASFPVYWGFECEWHPGYESWYRDYLRHELGAEYLVYGSHWVSENGEFLYIPEYPGRDRLIRYANMTVEGIQSGLYDYIAHPDIFLAGYPHLDETVLSVCREIISAAVAAGLPMEINGLGLSRQPIAGDGGSRAPYPVREFWEMAAEAGAIIICNSDAHRPEDVLKPARNARRFAEEAGLSVQDPADVLSFVRDNAVRR